MRATFIRTFTVLALSATAVAQSAVRPLQLMRAAEAHAKAHGGQYRPVLSPMDSPASGVTSEDIAQVRAAGFGVVVWTVDDAARQQQLFDSGVEGIISDRPDLLRSLVERNRTARGNLLDSDGLLQVNKFDAQGHRGARDLRPESTFPAFEVALDNLVTTLETDVGITRDGVAVLSHERHVNWETCRDVVDAAKGDSSEIRIKDMTADELRRRFVCDKLIRGPEQKNGTELSPVSNAFAKSRNLTSVFVHPRLQELFDFVRFYEGYYSRGTGKGSTAARRRSHNASRVRFNLETKLEARVPEETVSPEKFVEVLAGTIVRNHLEARCDLQSFDFRTLVLAQEKYPSIRTVYLVGTPSQLKSENLPRELRVGK